jgi:hypothetical protein
VAYLNEINVSGLTVFIGWIIGTANIEKDTNMLANSKIICQVK